MNETPTENQLFDSKVEVYARMLAKQRGFDPDQLVFFGEPERISLSSRGYWFLAPDRDQQCPVWQCFIHDVQVALAVVGMLPGQGNGGGE